MKSIETKIFIFVAAAFLLSPPQLSAQYFGKNKVQYTDFKWKYLQSKYFDIYFTEGGEEIAHFVAAEAEAAYRHLSADFDIYLTSAFDGHHGHKLTKLVSGQKSEMLEELHWLRPGISWSPDGKRLAFVSDRGWAIDLPMASDFKIEQTDYHNLDIYTIDTDGSNLFRVTNTPEALEHTPVFSPVDGAKLAFISDRTGIFNLYLKNLPNGELLVFAQTHQSRRHGVSDGLLFCHRLLWPDSARPDLWPELESVVEMSARKIELFYPNHSAIQLTSTMLTSIHWLYFVRNISHLMSCIFLSVGLFLSVGGLYPLVM
jgi:hypothetical protein